MTLFEIADAAHIHASNMAKIWRETQEKARTANAQFMHGKGSFKALSDAVHAEKQAGIQADEAMREYRKAYEAAHDALAV